MKKKKTATVDEERLYFEVGFRIRVAREARKMSQTELAKKIGRSRFNVVGVELARGGNRPPLYMIYRIARALNCRVSSLLPSMTGVKR